MQKSAVDWALYYADLGYAVFPCVPGGKTPMTEHGHKDASRNPDTIEAWWARCPTANIGIPTEGLCIVDIDGQNNPWPGPERTVELTRGSGAVASTPRGGAHHWFRQPDRANWGNTTSRLAPLVDTRATGGYVVVPPSVVAGRPYEWVETFELETGPEALPEPPAWISSALTARTNLATVPSNGTGNPIPDGQRNSTLAKLGGAMRRMGMPEPEILVALEAVNQGRCRPPLGAAEVAKVAASVSRYEPDQITVAVTEGHFAQDFGGGDMVQDPGPLPDELLRVPGFVSEVMDYCLETAPYPNQAMAFAGALALQSLLCARKVRDPGDNRSNIYLLGLAHSSSGKDRPRKVNLEILHTIGQGGQVGNAFASGEGLQDALFVEPAMLFQTDEIDGMLQSINKSRDARYEAIMGTLLTLYSSANSVFPMRRKANTKPAEANAAIDQPCLSIFGTAIPNHYYEALSERMLTNGFFARMIVVECVKRAEGQEPKILDIPKRVLETAAWWANHQSGGNLAAQHPKPAIVPQTPEAVSALVELRQTADAEYAKSEAGGDPVGTTVWGRVSEGVRKLALLHAVSVAPQAPVIDAAAVRWASAFMLHQTRHTLPQAASRVAATPFEADCLRCLRKIREAENHELPHQVLLKKMGTEAKAFQSMIATLEQRGDIEVRIQSTTGRPGRFYSMRNGTCG